MNNLNTRAIILAAGKSTRFKTKKTKLLFSICGQTMILYPLKILESLDIPITLVLGHQADDIMHELNKKPINNLSYILQREQLGTGHAVACTQHTWDRDHVLILYGDMPLLTKELVQNLINEHVKHDNTISFFTSYVIDPIGYGRVLEKDGKFRIVEEKDCNDEQRYINRINAGIYVMKRAFLHDYISKLEKSSITGEIYLPELIRMACEAGLPVQAISVPFDNIRGVNTLQELWGVEQIKRSEFIKRWMARGVRFELAQSIHIDINVEIGPGSFIGTGAHLLGSTKIGEECFIGAFSIVEDTTLGDSSVIHSHSIVQRCFIGNNAHIGPFARLRDNSRIEDHVEIGNFVEMKNSTIGAYSKTRHLSYISDATIGSQVKTGPGLIISNFNGSQNSKTIIEDRAFVEGNNTLIAPITIGKDALVTAGSTISNNVPAATSASACVPQTNSPRNITPLAEDDDSEESQKNREHYDKTFQFTGALKSKKDQRAEF
jgi:bifunctional UDP-N-acetylglucosamine pyrophosphorylase/glucosamine-1-phosphate N-acetyltransferase